MNGNRLIRGGVGLVAVLLTACSSPSAPLSDANSPADAQVADAPSAVGDARVDATVVTFDAPVTSFDASQSNADAAVTAADSRGITIDAPAVSTIDATQLPPDARVIAIDASVTIDAAGAPHVDAATVSTIDASHSADAAVVTGQLAVTITSSPSDPTQDSNGAFAFSSTGPVATTQCSFDNGGFAPCTSPYLVTLTNGEHSFTVEVADAADNQASASVTFTAQNLGVRWRRVPSPQPQAGYGIAGMAYDSVRQRTVLVTGADIYAEINDTWEWDGESWNHVQPLGASPSSIITPSLTYDSDLHRTLLFGVALSPLTGTSTVQTWQWDGRSWKLLQSVPYGGTTTNAPLSIYGTIVYDPAQQRTILFGGSTSGNAQNVLNGTWQWDDASSRWFALTPDTVPPARFEQGMAYDPAHGTIVMFGGADAGGNPLDDTWLWDGSNWTQAEPNTSPDPDFDVVMAFDTSAQQTVMQNGVAGSTMWVWDGADWSAQSNTSIPPTRCLAAGAYDAARSELVTFGGFAHSGLATDQTWILNGPSWRQLSTPVGPDPLDGGSVLRAQNNESPPASAYDPTRFVVVTVFVDASTQALQTWEWNGVTWTLATSEHAPSARVNSSLAYDSNSGGVLLFGGATLATDGSQCLAETWLWDGGDWTQLSPATTSPPCRGNAAMVQRGQSELLLFGGNDQTNASFGSSTALNDTWQWDGVDWTNVTPDLSPVSGGFSSMAYNAAADQLELFNADADGDLWISDGTSWSEPTGGIVPQSRTAAAMIYDDALDQAVIFGGVGSRTIFADTWTWNGEAWTQRITSPSPTRRLAASMSYASIYGEGVLFGGAGADLDTWILETPLLTLIKTPSVRTNNQQPALSFSTVATATTVECQIDEHSFAPCTSPFIPSTPLAAGPHSYRVLVVDTDGSTGIIGTSFIVDIKTPTVTVDTSNAPTFAFSLTGAPSTVECGIDGGDFVPCGSPFIAAGLAAGNHSIDVRVIDAAGNSSDDVESFSLAQ